MRTPLAALTTLSRGVLGGRAQDACLAVVSFPPAGYHPWEPNMATDMMLPVRNSRNICTQTDYRIMLPCRGAGAAVTHPRLRRLASLRCPPRSFTVNMWWGWRCSSLGATTCTSKSMWSQRFQSNV